MEPTFNSQTEDFEVGVESHIVLHFLHADVFPFEVIHLFGLLESHRLVVFVVVFPNGVVSHLEVKSPWRHLYILHILYKHKDDKWLLSGGEFLRCMFQYRS